MQNLKSKIFNFLKAKSYTLQAGEGFSLIEMMVAIGIFAVVVMITSSTFITSLKGQQKSIAVQNVADNARYAMEIMAKEIRMGDAFVGGGDTIQFISNMPNRAGKTVRFRLDSSAPQILFDDDLDTAGDDEPITGSNSAITTLRFTISGTDPGSQPRVTILLGVTSSGTAPDVASSMTLQTTVSPRSL